MRDVPPTPGALREECRFILEVSSAIEVEKKYTTHEVLQLLNKEEKSIRHEMSWLEAEIGKPDNQRKLKDPRFFSRFRSPEKNPVTILFREQMISLKTALKLVEANFAIVRSLNEVEKRSSNVEINQRFYNASNASPIDAVLRQWILSEVANQTLQLVPKARILHANVARGEFDRAIAFSAMIQSSVRTLDTLTNNHASSSVIETEQTALASLLLRKGQIRIREAIKLKFLNSNHNESVPLDFELAVDLLTASVAQTKSSIDAVIQRFGQVSALFPREARLDNTAYAYLTHYSLAHSISAEDAVRQYNQSYKRVTASSTGLERNVKTAVGTQENLALMELYADAAENPHRDTAVPYAFAAARKITDYNDTAAVFLAKAILVKGTRASESLYRNIQRQLGATSLATNPIALAYLTLISAQLNVPDATVAQTATNFGSKLQFDDPFFNRSPVPNDAEVLLKTLLAIKYDLDASIINQHIASALPSTGGRLDSAIQVVAMALANQQQKSAPLDRHELRELPPASVQSTSAFDLILLKPIYQGFEGEN